MLNLNANTQKQFNTCKPMRNTFRAVGFNGFVGHANFTRKHFDTPIKIPIGKRKLLIT